MDKLPIIRFEDERTTKAGLFGSTGNWRHGSRLSRGPGCGGPTPWNRSAVALQLVDAGTTSISVNPNGVHAAGRLAGFAERRTLVEAAGDARQ
jgi:hypothetical protein